MAATTATSVKSSIDPNNSFCSLTKTFNSLRPNIPLPHSPNPFPNPIHPLPPSLLRRDYGLFYLVNDGAVYCLYKILGRAVKRLKKSNLVHDSTQLCIYVFTLQHIFFYFVFCSNISPTNPDESASLIAHQINLSRLIIAFTTFETSHKLPSDLHNVLIDLPEFLDVTVDQEDQQDITEEEVDQVNVAAIMYSLGTTRQSKVVLLTHSLHSSCGGVLPCKISPMSLAARALFHIMGLTLAMRSFSIGEALVLSDELLRLKQVLASMEKYKVNYLPLADKYDLSSLTIFLCGGLPLSKEVADNLTECKAMVAWPRGSNEARKKSCGCAGQLSTEMYVSVKTLNVRMVLHIHIGDEKATAETLDSEGWLKTGDLCYIDSESFLYIVDRLKELIKYNGYQVALAELEHLSLSNPNISDAAVLPYVHSHYIFILKHLIKAAQIPMAFVVRKSETSITEYQVMDFIAEQT
ncbi:hypothetical protein ACOSQ4_013528 [Xanthoceras sorbifolium]